jgi:hypothetical protein
MLLFSEARQEVGALAERAWGLLQASDSRGNLDVVDGSYRVQQV